jgi:hypothetical protein
MRIPVKTTAQVITKTIAATIYDCAISMSLLQADGSALPSYITYNVNTKTVTVNVSTPMASSSVTLKACAKLNDKITVPKTECKETQVEIFSADSLTFSQTTHYYETEKPSQEILFDFPTMSWTPSDAITQISYALTGAPAFLILEQSGD